MPTKRRTLTPERTILDVVESVEARCMAADGPVTPTLREMTEAELRRLWKAAKVIAERSPTKRRTREVVLGNLDLRGVTDGNVPCSCLVHRMRAAFPELKRMRGMCRLIAQCPDPPKRKRKVHR